MKNVLVTGGAGFIGSHLCARLVEMGKNVISIDNYSTGSKKNHYPRGVHYIKLDTKDITHITGFKPDLIFHLGEYSRVEQSFNEPSKVWEYNLLGTQRILDYTRECGAKLIYAGSSTKFAGENMSPYAFSKATNTKLVMNYGDWYGIDYAITYFYNVYGPREIAKGTYATLIAKFLDKYKNGEPLTVTLPGTQQRNFTHIDDTIDALMLVAEFGYGDEYGIGNPRAYSVIEIAEMFNTQINYTPERQGNRISAPVISSKTLSLGWNPAKSVEDYIKREMSK